jgi:protein-S-isoprenylcysteine O-methyltransferase Ste14
MNRTLVLIYGLLAYVIFLAAFLYAVAFVGDFAVPRTIDRGPVQGIASAIAIDVALLLLFAAQHSIMARPRFKAWWTKIVPRPAERSTYVLASSLVLALLYWQWRPIRRVIWNVVPPQNLTHMNSVVVCTENDI